jgi:hypothetical protein
LRLGQFEDFLQSGGQAGWRLSLAGVAAIPANRSGDDAGDANSSIPNFHGFPHLGQMRSFVNLPRGRYWGRDDLSYCAGD